MSRSATCCNDLSSSTNPGNKMVKGSFERAVDTNWKRSWWCWFQGGTPLLYRRWQAIVT